MSKAGDARRWRRPLIRLRYRFAFWLAIGTAIVSVAHNFKLTAENKRLKHTIWVLEQRKDYL